MSPETEPLRRVPKPAPELDAEGEVDFGRYARAVLGKWWLLLLGVLVGGALGFLYGQGGGSTYQAQATVYLGQPLSPTGTAVATLASDPSGVATLARSQAIVNDVAAEVGMPARRLRRGITAAILGERNRQTTNVALVGITVRGNNARNGRERGQPDRRAGRDRVVHLRRRPRWRRCSSAWTACRPSSSP